MITRVNQDMSSKLEILIPHNNQLVFIDPQPQTAFGVQSIDRQVLKNNVVGLAKAAKPSSRLPSPRWRRRIFPARLFPSCSRSSLLVDLPL